MSTLHERLETAVRERLALARAATPGPWSQPYEVVGEPGDDGWWILNGAAGTDEHAVAVTLPYNPRAEADARLIAANGPDRIVRDCLEDLDVLTRHSPGSYISRLLDHKPTCVQCSQTNESAWMYYRTYPCPDVRSLARRYQIPMDGD